MANMTTDKPGTQLKAKAPAKKAAAKPSTKADTSHKYVDPVNSPVAKGAPVDDHDERVFHQGRTAALGGISKDDAPYDPSDAKHKTWLKGHKSVHG